MRRPQGQVGTIFRDFARLPQDLWEVPELGKDRVGLDRTIRNTAGKYTRDRQRARGSLQYKNPPPATGIIGKSHVT